MDEWENTTGIRYYLTREDPPRVVPEDDPAAAFLLVAAGGRISLALAEHYGLTGAAGAAGAAGGKARSAPANKAKPPPSETKGEQ